MCKITKQDITGYRIEVTQSVYILQEMLEQFVRNSYYKTLANNDEFNKACDNARKALFELYQTVDEYFEKEEL